jgi:acetoin utilization deacetylase AcuC-like enzyme
MTDGLTALYGHLTISLSHHTPPQSSRQGVPKVLIVDWDIHHGNGTQRAFLSDPSVLYFSVHRYDHGRFFPGTGNPCVVGQGPGEGFTINVAWEGGGMGDREYLAVWRRLLLPVARAFAPQLVLVSAGFDGADGDEMGGCRVTPGGFGAMTRALVEGVPSAGGRVVLALEGGYKLSVLSQCVEACLEALLVEEEEEKKEEDGGGAAAAKCPRVVVEEATEGEGDGPLAPAAEEAIARALEVHMPYWPCLRE